MTLFTSNKLHKNKHVPYILNVLILCLLSLVFVWTDWMYNIVTFSEIIIMILLVMLFLSDNIYLNRKDIYFILAFLTIMTLHNVINEFITPSFILRHALAGKIKIIFFTVFVLTTFRYIIQYDLKYKVLKTLNISALIVTLIGIYIVIGIRYENVPYQFLWTYTRMDKTSYFLMETIRMRSIFSEPAHLGYYYNIILGLNLFTSYKNRIPKWYSFILISSVMLTFSFSSIIITSIILSIRLFQVFFWEKENSFNYKHLIYILLFIGIIYYNWDFLYRTVFIRSLEIIQGEDTSALSRFFDSWIYFDYRNAFTGNGIGNSPPITNNYAYMLTDFGVIGFIISLVFTSYLLLNNFGLGVLFVLLNIQKGGYLSPAFAILMFSLVTYTDSYNNLLDISRNLIKKIKHNKKST